MGEMNEVKKKSFLNKYKVDILVIAVIALIAFIFSKNYAILLVQGESMYPTYNHKDILILKKESEPINGDIVVFSPPESWGSENDKFIKRIIASEGDVLTISGDDLIVNDKVVANIADKKCNLTGDISVKLDEDKYFFVGDNYYSSNDSLTQLCNQNKDFLIDKSLILMSGKEFKVIGGIFK
ncbi:MAG: signal peptidase I [Firmicutes bacterium]|nr:signal peptidase I [Bacillota bacterium]